MGFFQLKSDYKPSGDQAEAIKQLLNGLDHGMKRQTLQGVTGSGKTFTMANVIREQNRPVLVLSHNKTLAAQLYSEFKAFFPDNAVEYFISYYDYYLPESYIPQTDTYIAKDASINENIEKLRLSTTSSLTERRDVIVVASVSCIYGLGSPEDYANMCVMLTKGETVKRDDILRKLVEIQYNRNDVAPEKGEFRVRGDSVDVFEPQRDDFIRITFWGDEVEALSRHDALAGRLKNKADKITLFPCKHFVLPQERIDMAAADILAEMKERVHFFEKNGQLVEAQRLYQRVKYDLEMMHEIGYCSGIENYSMHLSGRKKGSRPYCLFDFLGKDFLTFIDESHVTLPQFRAMYKADRCRKQVLLDHGFRLESALENRPLQFEEIEKLLDDTVFVSATPGAFELEGSSQTVRQIIRPTGLLDPEVEVRPLENQVDDVIDLVRDATAKNERTIITTLTKKGAERLSDYLGELGINVSYIHSEMDAMERVRVLSKLKNGDFDCIIGINLLREGIDLPEVALVAILDADKEGFLRSGRALIQVAGRAARNVNGRVVLYGDKITPSMQQLLDETAMRRKIQTEYNQLHHITPKTITGNARPTINEVISATDPKAHRKQYSMQDAAATVFGDDFLDDAAKAQQLGLSAEDLRQLILDLENEMLSAAEHLEFERAADLRDQLKKLKK